MPPSFSHKMVSYVGQLTKLILFCRLYAYQVSNKSIFEYEFNFEFEIFKLLPVWEKMVGEIDT